MEPSTYIQYANLRGRPSTLEELHALLGRYDRRSMLRLCAGVSFSLDFVVGKHTETVHKSWVLHLFPGPEAKWILDNKLIVFHRHQLLFLMQEIVRCCPDLDESQGAELPLQELGDLFLMASEQLYSPVPDGQGADDAILRLILLLLPSSEANLFVNAILKMARAHLIITQIAQARRQEKGYFDIPAVFEDATGISYSAFQALMVGVFTRLINVDQALRDANQFGIDASYFANTGVRAEQIGRFFSLVSATPEEYAEALNREKPRSNDFRVIRDKPIAKLWNRYFPLDAHIGIEKFETAVYWSILKHLPEEQKKVFPVFWGNIFEDYVVWLLRNSVNERINRIVPDPRYADNNDQQVCDVIVQCGSSAIFIEIKGNTITSEAKYSNDLAELRKELEHKWVGTEAKRKGVLQLVSAIRAICCDERPRAVEGIDMRRVSNVIPVVVTRDEFGGYMGVNTYMNERFKNALGRVRYRTSITPLVCICVDSLEKLSPYLGDTALSEFFCSRIRADKKLSAPFFASLGPILEKKNRGQGDRQPTILRDATYAVTRRAAEFLRLLPPDSNP
jgi:hypothetical protein